MANKRKLAAAAVAVAASAALLMGGTFAWQSISQTALNEASDVINPGGRLHDDFYIDNNGDYNADIYVENFAEDTIFARVKLQEYMEFVINQGTAAEVSEEVVGTKTLKEGATVDPVNNPTGKNLYDYTYVTHYFDQENLTDAYWKWFMGDTSSAEVWYMPTFNMNKDSLVADRNGMYVDRIGGISNRSQDQYEDWTVWTDGNTKDGEEIHDTDSNTADEVGYDFDNLSTYVADRHIAIKTATHTAKPVGHTNGLISMSDWLNLLNNGEDTDSYWVYDTDGWVYWSSPIAGGDATGLLLDGIELNQVMDDTWYYAINVIGQFCTAGDVDGFYNDGEAPSADAEILLEEIGAGTGEAQDGEEDSFTPQAGTLNGMNMALHFDTENISVDEATNGLTVNGSDDSWERGDVILSGENLPEEITFSQTENKLYKRGENGEYQEESTAYVDIEFYKDSNQVDILCSTEADGQYKIVSTYTDETGNAVWEGSLEFTIVSVVVDDGDDSGEDEDTLYSTINLWHDGHSDTMTGGEWLLFDATVYDADGNEIAYTDEVNFAVQEVTASGAATMALFDTTTMDGNALFVAKDILERGVTKIVVSATYSEDDTTYEGTYELATEAGESPLKIGLKTNGIESIALPGTNVYQMFPANPSENTYVFNTSYNDGLVNSTWRIEPMDRWYTVGVEGDICYAYAIVDENDVDPTYDWTPEGSIPVKNGDKVAQINTKTGEFKVLIVETFPYTMQFDITAEYTVNGETYENSAHLFLGRVVANFLMYNADTEDYTSIAAHSAQYTTGEDSVINLGFHLTINDEEQIIDVNKLQNWVLVEETGSYGGEEIDSSLYTITTDAENGTATLTIPAESGISCEELALNVKYNHGHKAPRTPNGISDGSLSIVESGVAAGDGDVTSVEIMDEYGDTETTYTKGTYQKIKLEAYPYTDNGEEVYSGTIIWAVMDNPENVRLVQNGFSAEVQLMKAEADKIVVKAMYSKPDDTSIHVDATFTITAESDGGETE